MGRYIANPRRRLHFSQSKEAMRFDVYCDECRPDLLSSQQPPARYMVIGSLWLRTEDREAFKVAIHELRDKHKVGGEIKWQKVSPSVYFQSGCVSQVAVSPIRLVAFATAGG